MFFWKARPFSVGGAPVLPPGARANLNLVFFGCVMKMLDKCKKRA